MTRDTRLGRAVVVAGLIFTLTGTCLAQEAWESAPTVLSAVASTGNAILGPRVAADGAGNVLAIWWQPSGSTGVVQVARRTAATGTWSAARTISAPGQIRPGDWPTIVVDSQGDATAVWEIGVSANPFTVFSAHYDAATDTWAAATARSSTQATGALGAAGNAAGDVMLVWGEPTQLVSAFYSHTTDTWSAAAPLATEVPLAVATAIDGAGDGIATWQASLGTPIRVSRYSATAGTWTAPIDLTGQVVGGGPRVAVNEAGDAALWWFRANNTIEAVTSARGTTTWSAPVTLAADGSFNVGARGVVDVDGNAVVAWVHTEGLTQTLRASRYTKATTSWSAGADLPSSAFAYGPPAIGADAAGNVFVVWSRSLASPGIPVLAARYARGTGLWTVVTDLSTVGHSAFNPSVAVDAAGNATAAWFQSAGGASANVARTWRATLPPPAVTAASPAPGQIALSLQVPASGEPALAATNLEYSLDDGLTWTPRSPAAPTSPLTIGGLSDGTLYSVRLRTVNGAGHGGTSAAVALRSGLGNAPTGLRVAARTGRRLTFAWLAPSAGLVPESYVLEGGLAGTSQVLATVPTGGAATQFTLDLPAGRFFVQMVGVTAAAPSSPPSSALTIVTDDSTPPSLPANVLTSGGAGRIVALSWTQRLEDSGVTGTRVFLSGRSFQTIDLPPVESVTGGPTSEAGVGVAVAATRTPLSSGLTTAVAVDSITPCTAPPQAPLAFSASTQGGVVYLDWLPPAAGEAVTGYVVSASGSFTGSFATPVRTLAIPAPSGSFTLRVAAAGLCGTGAFTAGQTVVVP